MSDQHDKRRKAWVRGDKPERPEDEFARRAAAGREELNDADEAADLLAEIDGLIEARYGGGAAGDSAVGLRNAEKVEKSKEGVKVRPLRRWLSVAAALLLLLAAGWWWSRQPATFDTEASFLAAFEPYANDLSSRTMGGDDDSLTTNQTLAAAALAYDRQDYSVAADSFAVYLSTDAGQGDATERAASRLYYGISLLASNRAEEAQSILAPLREDSEYDAPASWYHALARLKAGDTPGARTELENLPESSPFRSRADRLLLNIP